MSDQQQNNSPERRPTHQTLSEISHLFLTSVRDRQTGGPGSRPKRTPPQQPAAPVPNSPARMATPGDAQHIDLTPEEFAHVFDDIDQHTQNSQDAEQRRDDELPDRTPPVTAMIAAHLNGHQHERVREYAAHLCKSGQRIGLIEVDASEFRLTRFERGGSPNEPRPQVTVTDVLEPRRMAEALEEMNWDVDHWLMLLPSLRGSEARAVLRLIDRWTVLATCDHDGVVSCYRTLKGLSDMHEAQTGRAPNWPALGLALLDASDEMTAMRVFRKLSGVCQQFLHWPLESEAPVQAAGSFIETPVLACRSTRDKAQLASAPQWQVVLDFLKRGTSLLSSPAPTSGGQAKNAQIKGTAPFISAARTVGTESVAVGSLLPQMPGQESGTESVSEIKGAVPFSPSVVSETDSGKRGTVPLSATAPAVPAVRLTSDCDLNSATPSTTAPAVANPRLSQTDVAPEVIDLPVGAESAAAIVSATLRGGSELVECPVKPPMLPDGSLAVARDRRLVLLAVARQGLSDLGAIGEAFRWMNENRALISMAVPQLSIDTHQMPHLRLFIDRADLSATTLQPLLQTGNVTVHTYRKLRWGPKTGLLLEAA